MVFPSNLENVAIRFSSYIDELREFFKAQNVRFGQPEDLTAFADRVDSSASFREDMGSLVRTILYREAEKISRVELFEVLVLAVAGRKIEESTQEFHEQNRRVFAFVNQSMHARRRPLQEDEPAAEPSKAAEIAAPRVASNEASESSRSHVGSFETVEPASFPVARPLFSAFQNEPAHPPIEAESRRPRGPAIFLFAIAALLLAGATFYFGRSGMFGGHPRAVDQPAPGAVVTQAPAPVKSVSDCTGAPQSGSVPGALIQEYKHVKDLKFQKRYDAALTGLRDIAASDPGYPGINLDISDLDLQMRRAQQARDAVSAQIAISDCLATLPAPALDAYCKAEFPLDTTDTCHSSLGRIKASAQLQAGVVTQELSRSFAVASSTGRPRQTGLAATVPATRSTIAVRGDQPHRPAARRPSRDQSLVEGQGTDSALGAYSKPEN